MKSPKGFRGKYFSLAAILALSSSITLANETKRFDDKQSVKQEQSYAEAEEETPKVDETPIVIVSKKSKVKEVDAPFASEIYTKRDIKKSLSNDIYEFLNTQTSITTLPAYGNHFSQQIDLRGYGLANGYENVVITLDGQRLNNIDGLPQMLSQIPLESIERIEILKGTGSVEYGDGANAGVINIITKDFEGANVKTYFGSHDTAFGSLGFGAKYDKFSINGYIDKYNFGGFKDISTAGQKDEADSENKSIKFTYTPHESLSFYLGKNFSNMGVFYPNSISLAQFEANPKTIPAGFTEQKYDIDKILLGSSYKINEQFSLNFDGSLEDKTSEYVNWASKYYYDTNELNLKLNYSHESLNTVFGISLFDSERKSSTTTTSKENLASFLKADIKDDKNSYSFGARAEKVTYKHQNLKDDETLLAYEAGYSYNLSYNSSLFASYNHSYLAPNIDMFFLFGGGFNGFIEPMKVDTLNIGYNYLGYPHRFKISAFYSKIDDEIYYNPTTWANTNIDETSKYGFELSHKYHIRYDFATMLNYAYVDTKIDKDATLQSGNEIPGVSNHNLKVGLEYKPNYKTTLNLSHTYKSKAYAMSDFDANFGKMKAYNSTDFRASYKLKNIEFFVKIDNLFENENALFVDGGAAGLGVYPVNYQRSFMLGMSSKF